MTNPLKTLEKMARKHRAKLSFAYCSGEYYWWGTFRIKDDEYISRDKSFTYMLHKLCKEVKRKEKEIWKEGKK